MFFRELEKPRVSRIRYNRLKREQGKTKAIGFYIRIQKFFGRLRYATHLFVSC